MKTCSDYLILYLIVSFLLIYEALAGTKDLRLVNTLGRIISENQDVITIDEISTNVMKFSGAIKTLSDQNIGCNLERGLDRTLIINTLALINLIDVSDDKCKFPFKYSFGRNVHKLNYINLAPTVRKFYYRENMLKIIDQYIEAQSFLCKSGLVLHFGEAWRTVQQTYDQAMGFKQALLSNFPNDREVDTLTQEERIKGVLSFTKEYNKIDLTKARRDQIFRTYNVLFRTACNLYAIDPFYTLMMTYEKNGRNRILLERNHGDIIRMYDLCTSLPEFINKIEDIGIIIRRKDKSTAGETLYMQDSWMYPVLTDIESTRWARQRRKLILDQRMDRDRRQTAEPDLTLSLRREYVDLITNQDIDQGNKNSDEPKNM